MTVSRVVISDIVVSLIVTGRAGFKWQAEDQSGLVPVRAVPAAGVAATAAFQVICGSKDQVWAFVIEIFRVEFLPVGWCSVRLLAVDFGRRR